MALIKNSFFEQVSLATIKKKLKYEHYTELEFWEAEINFEHNKSGFEFKILEPEMNIIRKNKLVHKDEFFEVFDKDLDRRGNVKRFWSKKDADNYILFNIMQIYKPLTEFVIKNNCLDNFNELLKEYPEKVLIEFGKGASHWILD